MGYDDPVGGRRIGVSTKRATAKKLFYSEHNLQSKTEGPRKSGIFSYIFVIIVSILLAWLVTMEKFSTGSGYHPTGFSAVDRFLTGSQVPSFTGSKDADFWILVVLRGLFVAFITGLTPFFTWLWISLTDRMRAGFYITCWGVSAMVLLLGYMGWSHVMPLLNDIFDFIIS